MKSSWISNRHIFTADLFDDFFFQILSMVMIDLQKEYLIMMYVSRLLKNVVHTYVCNALYYLISL